MKTFPGNSFPLGAHYDGKGVNFALFAENATDVELCLYDNPDDVNASERIPFTECTHLIWHMYVPDIKPCQLYGFRVNGPYQPENGHRFNPNKLLFDPYARAISGSIKWDDSLFGYNVKSTKKDLSFSKTDSGPFLPKCVVVDDAFDWEGVKKPNIPEHKSIIYEAHVKGFTKLWKEIPEEIRGTYAGIGHSASIAYFQKLGITAVELMPVHHFVQDRHLVEKGLSNYWGYNSISFLAPHAPYASSGVCGSQVVEFKEMVKALHKAGIEVILDVVYNHTAEGNQLGPTLSFKGIDNVNYYRLVDDKRYYNDYTGTGNTLNANRPNVLRLIMDSLRYWIEVMQVDGFRFDLASSLARELHEVDKLSAFFDIIHQDPVISSVKLIAEPWDVGEGGYQVGNFPPGWFEWNGKYRDCVRDYWRGADSMLGDFAMRFTGSPDLYADDNRKPFASLNFLTAHDGFTLHDLVSYNDKHNEANGEDNKDGESHNRSWNCGAEGPTDDEDINKLRERQKRNLLTTLFLSQGVPMLVAGDEFSRTQGGNNNAYCQDNEISWLNWEQMDEDLLLFTSRLIAFRKEHPVFCRRKWFYGQAVYGEELEDICWFLPEGTLMTDDHWKHEFAKSLGVYLNGKGVHTPDERGENIVDDSFYVIFNAHHEPLAYTLPGLQYADQWTEVLNTYKTDLEDKEAFEPGSNVTAQGRSMIVLKSTLHT